MVIYNAATRELTAKIVYYGPGLCGKTTNLKVLHDRLEPGTAGKLLNLQTQTDRTIYFDLLPVELGDIKGYKIRFQLATVPGQTAFNETRRVVLKGVDGIVFVADSQWTMLPKNLEAWQNLKDNLKTNGITFEAIPVVVQYNKRDLADILAVDAMQEALGLSSYPFVEAVASAGRGVTETFKLISKLTFVDLLRRLQGRRAEEDEAGARAAEEMARQDDLQTWKDSLLKRESQPADARGRRGRCRSCRRSPTRPRSTRPSSAEASTTTSRPHRIPCPSPRDGHAVGACDLPPQPGGEPGGDRPDGCDPEIDFDVPERRRPGSAAEEEAARDPFGGGRGSNRDPVGAGAGPGDLLRSGLRGRRAGAGDCRSLGVPDGRGRSRRPRSTSSSSGFARSTPARAASGRPPSASSRPWRSTEGRLVAATEHVSALTERLSAVERGVGGLHEALGLGAPAPRGRRERGRTRGRARGRAARASRESSGRSRASCAARSAGSARTRTTWPWRCRR